jgi:hypothetical protein
MTPARAGSRLYVIAERDDPRAEFAAASLSRDSRRVLTEVLQRSRHPGLAPEATLSRNAEIDRGIGL